MCFNHVRENLEKYFETLVTVKRKDDSVHLKRDIQALQMCKDGDMFSTASALFIKKWKTMHPAFVSYFQEQWIAKNDMWFRGTVIGQPFTNNSMPSTNWILKREHTMRERLPVGQVLESDLRSRYIVAWNEKPVVCKSCLLSNSSDHEAQYVDYRFSMGRREQEGVETHQTKQDCVQHFVASSTSGRPIRKKTVKESMAKEKKWKFDEFWKMSCSIVINSTDIDDCICTCFVLKRCPASTFQGCSFG